MDANELLRELSALKRTLPKGSVFGFHLHEGTVNLDELRIPQGKRGGGTLFLARVFAACDAHGVPARFDADATDLPDDPVTNHLVRWYCRFGCTVETADTDRVAMLREPGDPSLGVEGILRAYAEAKENDVSLDEIDRMRCGGGRRF